MYINKLTLFFIIIALLQSCKSEYTRLVEKELESGIVYDSLIFGMKIGMTKKQFFEICWDLNKKQLISEGPGNLTAKYIEPLDSLEPNNLRRQMLFYGIFDKDDIMHGMDITYQYITYAPWNEKTKSKALLESLLESYSKGYPGNPFIPIDLKIGDYKAYAKVDGNRLIKIYQRNDQEVSVKLEDLRYKYN